MSARATPRSPAQREGLIDHEAADERRSVDENGVPAILWDNGPGNNQARRGPFAGTEAPVYPVRRGRGLLIASVLHLLVLTPLLISTTRYRVQHVQLAKTVGITFVMAPLRGTGSPRPSARSPREPEPTAIEPPKPIGPEPTSVRPLAAAPLAPIVSPPMLEVPLSPASSGPPREESAASATAVDEAAASMHEETGGYADSSPPAVGTESERSNWAGLVLGRLEQFRRYPAAARRARQEGVCYVRFTLDRQGHVLASTLEHSSGHALLDRAAVELVRRADPLPPPPPELEGETVTLTVPVEFFLTR